MNKQHHKLYLETVHKQDTYAVLLYFIIMDECARNVIALLKQQLVLLGQGFMVQQQ
jgi:hypothetical protein